MFKSSILKNRFVLLCLLFLVSSAALLFSSHLDGGFWWSDSARHALNSVFLTDVVRDFPISRLRDYAIDYFFQYPALTILFYPPLFYISTIPFLLLFPESHFIVQFVVALYSFFLMWGSYKISRFYLDVLPSAMLAISFVFLPEMALWGRQVMLEIPAMCFLIWGVYFYLKYTQTNVIKDFYFCLFFVLCGLYTKLSLVFILPVFAAYHLWHFRLDFWKNKSEWVAAFVFLVAVMPLIGISYYFGKENVNSVQNLSDAVLGRETLENWLWYIKQLPSQLGVIYCILIVLFPFTILYRYFKSKKIMDNVVFLIIWLVIGYLFFSYVQLKEARHDVFIFLPLILFSFLALKYILSQKLFHLASVVLAVFTMMTTLLYHPVPYVEGYKQAVELIKGKIPENTNVMISAYRDGSFIFNMRVLSDRPDVSVIRADKLFLKIVVRRSLGVKEKKINEEQMFKKIQNSKISYVVAQEDFWIDIPKMAQLQMLLKSDLFEKIGEIKVQSNVNIHEDKLIIYKSLFDLPEKAEEMKIDLGIIGQKIKK